jgi:hypothetical protein
MKGKQKWHNTFDINGKLITNEVFFDGSYFAPYNGGLIVPIKEGTSTVFRYLQYQQFLFWDDELQDNVADPHFNYLKSDGYFKADAILIVPQDISNCNAVIKQNNELKVYSFCEDKIIEEAITYYTKVPFYGILVFTEEYVAFGNEWKRINCKHPISAEIENFGDIFNCKITMQDGSSIKIELKEPLVPCCIEPTFGAELAKMLASAPRPELVVKALFTTWNDEAMLLKASDSKHESLSSGSFLRLFYKIKKK